MQAPKKELDSVAQGTRKRLNQGSSSYVPATETRKKETTLPIDKPEANLSTDIVPPLLSLGIDESSLKETLEYIKQLRDREKRYSAFNKLNTLRDVDKNLPVLLWHSPGTIAILLQEVTSVYPHLNTTSWKQTDLDRCTSVLGLFQSLALDPRTRSQFLKSSITSQPPFVRVSVHKFDDATEVNRTAQSNQFGCHWSTHQKWGHIRGGQVSRQNRADCAVFANYEKGVWLRQDNSDVHSDEDPAWQHRSWLHMQNWR